jgi:hypothetical protein
VTGRAGLEWYDRRPSITIQLGRFLIRLGQSIIHRAQRPRR